MSRILDPGKYDGKIVDYGISKTSTGKKQAFIVFEIQGKNLTWYGGLDAVPNANTGKAQLEYTVKTLLDCGLSSDTIEVMAAGQSSNAIPIGKEMTLVVEDNTYEGNVSSRIKYVNELGFVAGPARMSYEEATGADSGALRAELARQKMMKKTGAPVPKSPL